MKNEAKTNHVCPVWVGYLLLSPLRRLLEKPESLLGPWVEPGMNVLEPGPGMGYFTLPLARMVGPRGKVICVDLQQRMIDRLLKRARKAGLAERIEASVCDEAVLGLEAWRGKIDLVAALHVIHEMADQRAAFEQFHALLREGGRILIVEPKGHVKPESFRRSIELARETGFSELPAPPIRRGQTALLKK